MNFPKHADQQNVDPQPGAIQPGAFELFWAFGTFLQPGKAAQCE